MRDQMHDWVVANEEMAKVLAAKGYHYQFVFARNAGHTDRTVKQQTLPEALEYLWQGYPIAGTVRESRFPSGMTGKKSNCKYNPSLLFFLSFPKGICFSSTPRL